MKKFISLLDFTSLDIKVLEKILLWRNNPSIKKWMFTQNDIQLDDHLVFVNSLKKNTKKKYFAVKKENQYIGVISFSNITKKNVIMGVYKNPEIHGVGKLLMEQIIDYSFNNLRVEKIYSEVFEENAIALNLYKSFRFKPRNSKIVDKRKVICMELVNENG